MNCALCQLEPRGEDSHIIPNFVYRWLKKISATGFIRSTGNINQRVQDGVKYPLLCKKCEDTFSVFEAAFANEVFFPMIDANKSENRGKQNPIRYGKYVLPFCVSVLWRALHFLSVDNAETNKAIEPHLRLQLEPTYQRWQKFLLGTGLNPD